MFAKHDRKQRSGEKHDGSEESGLQWQAGGLARSAHPSFPLCPQKWVARPPGTGRTPLVLLYSRDVGCSVLFYY